MTLEDYGDLKIWVPAVVAAIVVAFAFAIPGQMIPGLEKARRAAMWWVASRLGDAGKAVGDAKTGPVTAAAFCGFQVGTLVAWTVAAAALGTAATLESYRGAPAPWVVVPGVLAGVCALAAAGRVLMLALFYSDVRPR